MADKHLNLPESSDLMIENARLKAEAAIQQCPEYDYALGDDSGVFVRALFYFPGVHSRRWYGNEKDDHGRNIKLLELMKNETDRTTYLISCFALVDKNGKLIDKEFVKNKFNLAYEELGDKGFGYDKVLLPSTDMLENLVMDSSLKDIVNFK